MKCHKVIRLLVPLVEGELSGRLKEEAEAHLEICAACRKERDALSRSWQMLDSYAAPKAHDDFVPSLMKRIHAEDADIIKVTYKLPRFALRGLVPALASVVIAVLMYALFLQKPMQEKIGDREIVQNLDVLENVDLLRNVRLLSELDVVENLNDPTS